MRTTQRKFIVNTKEEALWDGKWKKSLEYRESELKFLLSGWICFNLQYYQREKGDERKKIILSIKKSAERALDEYLGKE